MKCHAVQINEYNSMRKKNTNIINDLLNYLEVKHTAYYVNKIIEEHPHSENMYGLGDILSNFGIDSVGVDLKDKEPSKLLFLVFAS